MEKQHSNLFYIFQRDYAEHPIPPQALQQLQETLFGMSSADENIHPP